METPCERYVTPHSQQLVLLTVFTTGLTSEQGIYVYPGSGTVDGTKGDHIIIAPAYNITETDLDIIIERVVKLIKDFFADEAPPRVTH
jgi:adenosylmethionine-8-amino-7-oxononanoate aminotransferase